MKTTDGFTLIELMVTVAIAGIVLTVGVPWITDAIDDERLTSKTNELVATLNSARSQALSEAQPVIVCGSTDGSSCNTQDWEQGWIVFVDDNRDDDYDSSSERLVRVQSGSQGFTRIRAKDTTNTIQAELTYDSDGFFGNAEGITITICDGRGAEEANAINIQPSGTPRTADDDDGDGKVETLIDASGGGTREVSCP